jgi:hypothetical protein
VLAQQNQNGFQLFCLLFVIGETSLACHSVATFYWMVQIDLCSSNRHSVTSKALPMEEEEKKLMDVKDKACQP